MNYFIISQSEQLGYFAFKIEFKPPLVQLEGLKNVDAFLRNKYIHPETYMRITVFTTLICGTS